VEVVSNDFPRRYAPIVGVNYRRIKYLLILCEKANERGERVDVIVKKHIQKGGELGSNHNNYIPDLPEKDRLESPSNQAVKEDRHKILEKAFLEQQNQEKDRINKNKKRETKIERQFRISARSFLYGNNEDPNIESIDYGTLHKPLNRARMNKNKALTAYYEDLFRFKQIKNKNFMSHDRMN